MNKRQHAFVEQQARMADSVDKAWEANRWSVSY